MIELKELIKLAKVIGVKHNLPGELVCAIIQTESAWNTFAGRYEPAFYQQYVPVKPKLFGSITVETERIMRATSFGLMQIMGQTARENGCTLPYLTALVNEELGIEYGCRYLAKQRDKHFAKYGWDGVIASYNAGSPFRDKDTGLYANQAYVNKVRSNMRAFTTA